jgi:hypothetical protein
MKVTLKSGLVKRITPDMISDKVTAETGKGCEFINMQESVARQKSQAHYQDFMEDLEENIQVRQIFSSAFKLHAPSAKTSS